MIVYLGIDFILLIAWVLYPRLTDRSKRIVLFFLIILLFFISSFRGDFTSDYKNYASLFWYYSNCSIKEILQNGLWGYPELGYLFFQFIIQKITGNAIFLFAFTSLLIILTHFKFIRDYSIDVVLALFLFVEAGTFYTSFNLVRQIMASGIVLIGTKYLVNKSLIKYCFVVLIASLFHKSAIIMIPAYFISFQKISFNRFIVYSIGIVVVLNVIDFLVRLFGKYAYQVYLEGNNQFMSGYSWKSIIAGFAIASFGLICCLRNKDVMLTNEKTRVFFNYTFLYLLFLLSGLKIMMVERFSSFFSPYAIILASNCISKRKSHRILELVVILALTVYGFLAKDSMPYYFVWE